MFFSSIFVKLFTDGTKPKKNILFKLALPQAWHLYKILDLFSISIVIPFDRFF